MVPAGNMATRLSPVNHTAKTIHHHHHYHHHHHCLIIELEEKPYFFQSLWSNEMDIEAIEIFQNNHLRGTDQKICSFWQAKALLKN